MAYFSMSHDVPGKQKVNNANATNIVHQVYSCFSRPIWRGLKMHMLKWKDKMVNFNGCILDNTKDRVTYLVFGYVICIVLRCPPPHGE